MTMTKRSLRRLGCLLFSLALTGCASHQCMQSCHAKYANVYNECAQYVAPMKDQAAKDRTEVACRTKNGFPRAAQSCDDKC